MNFSTKGQQTGFEWGERGAGVRSLYEELKGLKDRRKRRGVRYPLAVVLVMIVIAKLSGEDEIRGIAEWISHRTAAFVEALALKHQRTPHPTTISRILNEAVDLQALENVVSGYFKTQSASEAAIAIDGKALRGTIEPGSTRGQHLLAAYAVTSGVVVGQLEVGRKHNEISVAPHLLETVNLKGCIVTGDAMFAQHALSQQIVEAQGHYLWVVKDNQPALRAAIERLFASEKCRKAHSPLQTDFQTALTLNKGHGRLEHRTLTSSGLLKAYSDWEGAAQVFRIERQVLHIKSGKVSHHIDYGITSLPPDHATPQQLLSLLRAHWHIENRLHYPRDVSFHEDACHIRAPSAHLAIAILNNLALALIRQLDFDFVPSARRGSEMRLSHTREKGGRGVGWRYEDNHTYQHTASTGNFSMCQ